MVDKDLYIAVCAYRQIAGELLPEDIAFLETWLKETPANKEYFDALVSDFQFVENSKVDPDPEFSEKMWVKTIAAMKRKRKEERWQWLNDLWVWFMYRVNFWRG